MLPAYSVLMSVYAKEKPEFLKQSIDSILNQSVKTDDFVLVCDGELNSELDKVINSYGNKLQVYRIPYNVGLGRALNVGLKQCKNELVARMDSDDISIHDRCEIQLSMFEDNSKLDICSGIVNEFVDTVDNITGKRELPIDDEQIKKYSRRRCPFNHPCTMFKKSAVIRAGGYNGRFRMEDYFLWIRMMKTGCVSANSAETLLCMRTTKDIYKRRGGWQYTRNMVLFRWWMYKCGWSTITDFIFSAFPQAVICMLPSFYRRLIYKLLHR